MQEFGYVVMHDQESLTWFFLAFSSKAKGEESTTIKSLTIYPGEKFLSNPKFGNQFNSLCYSQASPPTYILMHPANANGRYTKRNWGDRLQCFTTWMKYSFANGVTISLAYCKVSERLNGFTWFWDWVNSESCIFFPQMKFCSWLVPNGN